VGGFRKEDRGVVGQRETSKTWFFLLNFAESVVPDNISDSKCEVGERNIYMLGM